MVGKYEVILKSPKVEYSITLKRKFTVIRGDSGSGKTKFAKLVDSAKDIDNNIKIISDLDIIFVRDERTLELNIKLNEKVIYILDEDICKRLDNVYFANLVEKAEGYFILITRKPFANIPYSALEIYNFVHRNSIGSKTYYTSVPAYEWYDDFSIDAENIIVEDKKAGFYFYKNTCTGDVYTAGGNGNICNLARSLVESGKDNIFIIADGSAFGSQIGKCCNLLKNNYSDKTIRLFIPESFEYLVLKSGILRVDKDLLDNTYNYAETTKYFSWERYYTELIQKVSSKYNLTYDKSTLPKYLVTPKAVKKMYSVIKEIKNVKAMDRG